MSVSEPTGQVWEEKNLPGQVSSKQRETRLVQGLTMQQLSCKAGKGRPSAGS